jgi:hypothetical protein
MLINVRGTNGSGKSTAVRYLLDTYGNTNKIEQEGWRKTSASVVGYRLPGNLIIAGRYEYFQMGGLDGFKYAKMWEELLPALAAEADHLVFESILISGNVGRGKALAAQFPCTFAFMDTTADECIRRIYARNGGAEFKEKLVRDTHGRMQVIKRNFTAQGELVTEIHDGPGLEALLRQNGWNPSTGV